MNDDEQELASPPPRKAERLLIELWPTATDGIAVHRVLMTTLGRAQAAEFVARTHAEAAVVVSLLDTFAADVVRETIGTLPANLEVLCEPDFTLDRDVDVAAVPVSSQGEAELTRERLQAAFVALRPGGVLLTTSDNPRDTWLGEVTASFGAKVRRIPATDGVGYVVPRGDAPPKRVRDFSCEFAFRDGERLLNVVSRPGVFSHRRVDPGARRLLDAMEVQDGDRVLDVGCGWGTVALAAACRANNVAVVALDSNTRAVQCTQRNAVRNEVGERLTTTLEAYGRIDAPGTFDAALANPPYYAQFQIAERFVTAAQSALRSGGRLWLVTKSPEWYLDRLPGPFREVEFEELKGYALVTARRK